MIVLQLLSVAMILLMSACVVFIQASNTSDLYRHGSLSEKDKQNPAKWPHREHSFKERPLSELEIFLSSSDNKDMRSYTHRTKLLAAYARQLKEGLIRKDSDIMQINRRRTTNKKNSTLASDSIQNLNIKDSNTTIFKNTNRSRTMKHNRQEISPTEPTVANVAPKEGLELLNRNKKPCDTEKNNTETAQEDIVELEATGEAIDNLTRNQNRPPWQNQIVDYINNDTGTENDGNKEAKKGENIKNADNVTSLDSVTESTTISHQNDNHATSVPDAVHGPKSKNDFTQETFQPKDQQELGKDLSKESSAEDNCPTCGKQRMTEEEVKQLRLGMFQDILMKKLRLGPDDLIVEDNDAARRSNDNIPKLPPSMIEQTYSDSSFEEEKEEFYAQDQEIVISGNDMGRNCISGRTTGCYSFDLEGKIKREVMSAELWLYKMRDANDISGQTFFVYELEKTKGGQLRRRNLIVRKDTFSREDWVRMDVTRHVKRSVDKKKKREMLALRCKTCATRSHKALYGTKHGYKPLLAIKYTKDLSMRGKRSTTPCDPSTRCCKRPLVANFSALNMMQTILSPTSLSIGYCFGSCDRIDLFTYNHTVIKQHTRLNLIPQGSDMYEQLKTCCVPLLLKSIFIMITKNGDAIRTLLPNVMVDECGCL